MNLFGDRLKTALKHAQMTQQQLADKIGISQQSIQYICSPKAKGSKYSLQIAEALNVSPSWLSFNSGDMLVNRKALNDDFFVGEAGTSYLMAQGTPLIEWDQITNETAHKAAPLIPCPITHTPNTYATIITNDSMTSMHGPSYPKGATIFVNPDLADSAKGGDRVIAKIGDGGISFKQLNEDDGRFYLQSLNTSKQIPIIDHDFKVIGVVIGTWMPE